MVSRSVCKLSTHVGKLLVLVIGKFCIAREREREREWTGWEVLLLLNASSHNASRKKKEGGG
jgi:hypothetical protein